MGGIGARLLEREAVNDLSALFLGKRFTELVQKVEVLPKPVKTKTTQKRISQYPKLAMFSKLS